MKKTFNVERRRAPRIDKELSLKLSGAAFDLITETKNISSRGVYCRVDRAIPYMSKLKVTLLLPVTQGGRTATHAIRTRAIVVRSEGPKVVKGKEAHFIALYFERLKQSDAKKIDRYVLNNIASHSVPSKK